MWWYTPIILALERMRQENFQFEVSLGYTVGPCHKNKKKGGRGKKKKGGRKSSSKTRALQP
jgi:hypothetical protein